MLSIYDFRVATDRVAKLSRKIEIRAFFALIIPAFLIGVALIQDIWWLPILIAMLVIKAITWLHTRRLAYRDSRLICPHCLTGLFRRRFEVVATQNCHHCHRHILQDIYPQIVPQSTVIRSTLEALLASRSRINRKMILSFSCVVIIVLPALGMMGETGWFDNASTSTLIVGTLCSYLLASLWYLSARWPRNHGWELSCPRCTGCCRPEEILKFGACCWCGQPLLSVESSSDSQRS